ncbi:alpha/beta fold hydrolase [Rubrobacter indicoceani]|uniref:alpha/beta fold hydrolase n=1 Tax=Rubrobacter indicoceani TaxID=2051957 RepID=UPI000E5A1BB1|nr:alpha/beta hydrolase [Rubrobacter indicoceani]
MPELRKVRTETLEIAYLEDGPPDAETVVLVHGFPDDATTWNGVSERLVAAGYRTLAPYLRGYGQTRFLENRTVRSGQIAALGQDLMDFIEALDLRDIVLVGHDWGARAAYIAAALMSERVEKLVALAVGYGTNDPDQRLPLLQTRNYWYQWFLNTGKGSRELKENRRDFCRYLWRLWSPGWSFTAGEFEATARSFENPDFVEIAVHSYRHRWGNAPSDPSYSALEEKLAGPPEISVPTIVLMGADDGATLPELSEGKELFFTGSYRREVLPEVGHFVQRERPDAVLKAVTGAV